MKLLDPVERLRAGLDYHLARHNLLTAILTHVDTPGFRPLDLERRADFEGQLHVALAPAAAGGAPSIESASAPAEASTPWRVVEDAGSAAGLDGNGVSVEREAVKIAANNVRYEALSSLVQNELASMAWAANDGRSG